MKKIIAIIRAAEKVVEAARAVYEEDDFVTEGVDDAKLSRDEHLGAALEEYDALMKGLS